MHLVRAEQREAWLEATTRAQLDVCAIVETFLDGEGERVLEYELKDSQFQWFGKVDRTLVGRRGVGMLIRKSLNPRIAKKSVSADLLWVVVGGSENPLYLGVVYLVPPTSIANTEKNGKLLEELQADAVMWQGKVVVMGDWNSRVGCLPNVVVEGEEDEVRIVEERSSVDKTVSNQGTSVMRVLNAAGVVVTNGMRGATAQFTSFQRKGSAVIDLICISHQLLPSWLGTDVWEGEESLGADHRMVVVTLKRKPMLVSAKSEGGRSSEEKTSVRVWKTRDRGDLSYWDRLRAVCDELMGWWCDHVMERAVDQGLDIIEWIWREWLSVHNETAERGVGSRIKKQQTKKPPQIGHKDAQVQDLARRKNELRKSLAKEQGEARVVVWKDYKQTKSELRKRMRWLRTQQEKLWNQTLEQLEVKDPKEFWRKLKALAGLEKSDQKLPFEMMLGLVLVGGEEALKVWKEAFQKLGRAQQADDPRFDRGFYLESHNLVAGWTQELTEGPAELGSAITLEEVDEAIKLLRRGKAAGVDGAANEILKYAGPEMTRSLWVLFNTLFEKEQVPQDWTRGLIVPIYKDGDKHIADNYRGITLLSVVGKLYTVILNKRLSRWCERNQILVDEQAGFREARSTSDQLFILREAVLDRSRRNKDTYCCFLDIKKAYDTVFREGLWRRLWEAGVKGKMWRVLKNIYNKVESSVVVNGKRGEWFELHTGVRQGCILSPTLFAIFIDGLAREVKARNLGAEVGPQVGARKSERVAKRRNTQQQQQQVQVSLLLFADDIVLLASSEENLQEMLHTVDQYSRRYRFEFNAKKSNTMVFSQQQNKAATTVRLGDSVLEQKTSYKYLGLEAERGWKWKQSKTRMLEKARKRMAAVCALGIRRLGLSVKAAIRSWEALVLPILEYGCEIWGDGKWREADQLQHEMGKRILGVSKRTSNAVVRGELGWQRLEARRDLARLRFWGKIILMSEDRLVKKVYRIRKAAVEQGSDKKNWCWHTKALLEQLGLGQVWVSEQIGATHAGWISQVKAVIKDREQKLWRLEVERKPKLRVYANLKTNLEPELYLEHENPWNRRLFTMLRSGTNWLRIEIGRWKKEPVEKRVCEICMSRHQVEDEIHFLLDCEVYDEVRKRMYEEISRATGHELDVRLMKDNRTWMLDVLIGHGITKYRQEILHAVMSYIAKASRIRREYSGDKEVG